MVLVVVGLALAKDGVHVMEKLVAASDHDHLVRLALISFLVVVISNLSVGTSPDPALYCQIQRTPKSLGASLCNSRTGGSKFPRAVDPGI